MEIKSKMAEMQEKSWGKGWDLVNGDNFDGLIYWRWSSPGGSKNTLSISNSSNKGNPHFNLFPVQRKESPAYSSFEEVSPHPMMELYHTIKSIYNTLHEMVMFLGIRGGIREYQRLT